MFQGKDYFSLPGQKRAPWLSQWNLAIQIISQAGLQFSYRFHGYWFEPQPEWFSSGRRLDVALKPFTLEQLGASALLLLGGMVLAALAFCWEVRKRGDNWQM